MNLVNFTEQSLDRLPCLTLKRRPAERERAAHPWIFSNEIQEIPAKVRRLDPGSIVEVLDCHGKFLGTGFWNPKSLIAVRLLSDRRNEIIDRAFFHRRFVAALQHRERFFGASSSAKGTYRAVFGESDGLPGLVIDRFGPVWVAQVHAIGMWELLAEIQAGLESAVAELALEGGMSAFVVRTDVQSQKLEGLPEVQEVRAGTLPKGGVRAFEAGIEYPVNVLDGQKTGFYFDQRQNRLLWQSWIEADAKQRSGLRVADLFCNSGAWGLAALKAGAASALFVDSSEAALDAARAAADKAGLVDRCEFLHGKVEAALKSLPAKSFDYVSLDPPSFIPNRKSVTTGMRGYATLNANAARIIRPGGILATSSCSHHALEEKFLDVVTLALRKERYNPLLLARGGAAADHPERPGMPESRYLKCLFLRIGS